MQQSSFLTLVPDLASNRGQVDIYLFRRIVILIASLASHSPAILSIIMY